MLPSALTSKSVGASGAVVSTGGLLLSLLLLLLPPKAAPSTPTPAKPTNQGNASKPSASVASTHHGVVCGLPPSA